MIAKSRIVVFLTLIVVVSGCIDEGETENDESEIKPAQELKDSADNYPENTRLKLYDSNTSVEPVKDEDQIEILEIDSEEESYTVRYEEQEKTIENLLFETKVINDNLVVSKQTEDRENYILHDDQKIENAERPFNAGSQIGYINKSTDTIEIKNEDVEIGDSDEVTNIDEIAYSEGNIFYSVIEDSRQMKIYKDEEIITKEADIQTELPVNAGNVYWIHESEGVLMENDEELPIDAESTLNLAFYEEETYFLDSDPEDETEILRNGETYQTVENGVCMEITVIQEEVACSFIHQKDLEYYEEIPEEGMHYLKYEGEEYGPYRDIHWIEEIDNGLAYLVTMDEGDEQKRLIKEE